MLIDHINIKAPKQLLEKEKQFYCDILGLKPGYRPISRNNGYWLYAGENPLVHLTEIEYDHAPDSSSYLDHVAFRLNGLDAFERKLNSLGIEYSKQAITEIGLVQLFLKSPAGIRIETNFMQT